MNKILTLYILSTLIFSLRGQPSASPLPEPSPFSGVIKGKVIEAAANVAVEYATVTLYTAKDSVMIDGVITNSEGYFEFKKLDAGEYNIIVRFMGFRKVFIAGIIVSEKKPVADVGNVSLRAETTDLKEVEVVGQAPLVEYKIDRKVVNVEQQLQAQGGTAVDVLERVPSIKTDLDGNVALRGSTSFTVLIDGKPSILTGSDALNQIPASTIDKIEIITNPSAKYDPDGTAGIINIITKKNSLKGLSGIVNLSAGTSPDYSGSLLLNYRTRKTSLSFGVDYGNRNMTGYRNSYRESFSDSSFLETKNKNEMSRQSISLKAGIDYSLSTKNTLTLEGNYRFFEMTRNGSTKNEEWLSTDANRQNYLTTNGENGKHPTYQLTLRDDHKFNKEGSELTTSLTFDQGDDKSDDKTFQFLTDKDWQDTLGVRYDYKTHTTEFEREIDGDLDFQHSFTGKDKLEAGFQLRMELNDMDYHYYNYDSASASWIEDMMQSNKYRFFNNIYAAYGTYSTEFKKLGLKAGLRAEYTDRNLRQVTGQADYPYRKFDLYPSLYLTYYLPYNQQVQLSYSKRVNRPHGGMLNPYVYFSDAFNSFSGNPHLEPEFSHALEFNYQKYFGYSFLTVETYYRMTNNKMTRVQHLNDTTGVMEMTMANIDSDRSLGIEMSGNIQVNSWFSINPVATVYDYKLNQESNITDSTNATKSSTNWNASVEFAANLKSNTRIRLNANYDSPTVTVDGTRQGIFYVGFSARQDLLKKNLSLTFNVRDVLNSRKMQSTSEAYNYYATSENWRKAPIFSLTISYKWNNYRRKGNGGESFDGDYDVINGGSF